MVKYKYRVNTLQWELRWIVRSEYAYIQKHLLVNIVVLHPHSFSLSLITLLSSDRADHGNHISRMICQRFPKTLTKSRQRAKRIDCTSWSSRFLVASSKWWTVIMYRFHVYIHIANLTIYLKYRKSQQFIHWYTNLLTLKCIMVQMYLHLERYTYKICMYVASTLYSNLQ